MLQSKLKKFLNRKDGYFLVTGPPGTGKTHLLIELLLYLLNEKKVEPSKILVFCFNRRWAKILREKIAESAQKSLLEIPITSFFSFCADFIEKYNFFIKQKSNSLDQDLNSFDFFYFFNKSKVLNATEQWNLLKEVINNLNKKNYPLTFKYINNSDNVYKSFMQEVFDFVLRAQENLLTPTELLEKLAKNTMYHNSIFLEIVGIYANYDKVLLKNNYYNYGRLLMDTVNCLKENSFIRNTLKTYYDTVIVDELQELNKAQFEIANLLSNSNIVFFGNDDESIYSFRGSMVNNFERVIQSIYKNEKPEENILFLKTNYRNNPLINKICSDFIALNEYRISKSSTVEKLYFEKFENNYIKNSVVVKEFKTTIDEINFIIAQIKKYIFLKKISPHNICILVKGIGYKTRLIENALKQNNILFIRRSSRTILESEIVQYIISLLKFINILYEDEYRQKKELFNTKNKLLESILISDFIGISPVFIKKLYFSERDDLFKNICLIVDNYLKEGSNKLGNYFNNIDDFSKLIAFKENMLKILKFKQLDVYNFVIKILNTKEIGIIDCLLKEKEILNFKKEDLLNILGDYLESLKDFSNSNTKNSINDYILFLKSIEDSSFLEEIEESTKEVFKENHVNILSYHQCKGFEFEIIFMPFINKNYLPAPFGNSQLYDLQIFNYFSEGRILSNELIRKMHLEQERNLFYNGMSRAKSFLFITSNKMEESSVFFEDILKIYTDNIKFFEKIPKISKVSPNNKNESDIRTFIYSNLNNKWLIRKTALSRTYKILKGLRVNIENYQELLSFLKLNYPIFKWWSTRSYTHNNLSPFKLIKPVFSYTNLNIYLECPYRFKMKNYISLKEEKNLSAIIGQIYHSILSRFFMQDTKDFSWEKLGNIIDDTFKNLEFEFEYLKKAIYNKTVFDFKNYFNNFIPYGAIKILTEKDFSFNFHGDVITGRIDQISFFKEGTIELVDFKSGSKKTASVSLENELQLRLYRLAVDLSPEMEFARNKNYILKYIFLGEERNQEIKLSNDFYNFKDFENFLKKLIRNIKKEKFEACPQSSYICANCDFKIVCPNRIEG